MEAVDNFKAERKLSRHTIEGMIAGTPDIGVSPDHVAQIIIMDLIVLLVEQSGRSPEFIHELVKQSLDATTVMN